MFRKVCQMCGDIKFKNVSDTVMSVMVHIEYRKLYTRKNSIISDFNHVFTASNKTLPPKSIKNIVRPSHQSF